MIAFLVVGLILGVLARTLRGGFGARQLLASCLAGILGALAGGILTNLAQGESAGDPNLVSLLVSAVVALVAIAIAEVGVRRSVAA